MRLLAVSSADNDERMKPKWKRSGRRSRPDCCSLADSRFAGLPVFRLGIFDFGSAIVYVDSEHL
jgi:hypothetical protein